MTQIYPNRNPNHKRSARYGIQNSNYNTHIVKIRNESIFAGNALGLGLLVGGTELNQITLKTYSYSVSQIYLNGSLPKLCSCPLIRSCISNLGSLKKLSAGNFTDFIFLNKSKFWCFDKRHAF